MSGTKAVLERNHDILIIQIRISQYLLSPKNQYKVQQMVKQLELDQEPVDQ